MVYVLKTSAEIHSVHHWMKEPEARLYFSQRLASCYSSRSVTSLSSSMLSVNTKAPCQGHRVTVWAAHGPDEKREERKAVNGASSGRGQISTAARRPVYTTGFGSSCEWQIGEETQEEFHCRKEVSQRRKCWLFEEQFLLHKYTYISSSSCWEWKLNNLTGKLIVMFIISESSDSYIDILISSQYVHTFVFSGLGCTTACINIHPTWNPLHI